MVLNKKQKFRNIKLQKHNKKPQKDDLVIVCNNCKKVFGQKGKYECQDRICGKPATRPCVKTFKDRNQLRIHTKQDHPSKAGYRSGFYKCQECGKAYRSISACRRHMKKLDQ